MDWKYVSIQRLKTYRDRKDSIEILETQLNTLEEKFIALRSVPTDTDPVMGGSGLAREDAIVDNIVLREELSANKSFAQRETEITEKGLSKLSMDERYILEKFYINRCPNHVEEVCRHLNIEKSEVYRRKNEALDRFTRICYGVVNV